MTIAPMSTNLLFTFIAAIGIGAASSPAMAQVAVSPSGTVSVQDHADDPLADRSGPPAPVREARITPVHALVPAATAMQGEAADATRQSMAGTAETSPARPAVEGESGQAGEAPGAAEEPRIIRGNDRVIAPPRAAVAPGAAATKTIELKFEQAPIAEVVIAILEDVAGVDYVIHPPLAGTITLSTRRAISADQAMLVLESVLQANGILIARDTRGVYHIGSPEAVKGIVSAPRLAGKGALPPGFGSVVVPLNYIGAGEMAEILRPVATPEAFLRVDSLRNLLVLAGSRAQVEGWLEIVNMFDVDLLKGMSVGVFPLRYASVREVDAALRMMTSGAGVPAGSAAGAAPPTGSAGSPATLAEAHPLYGAIRVMPIERLNSILVVTPRAAYLEQAREWIERLDRPGSSEFEARLFVYPVQNGSAAHLAKVLNGVFGDGRDAEGREDSGVAPGQRAVSASSAGASAFGLTGTNTRSTGLGAAGTAGALGSGLGVAPGSQTTATTAGVTTVAAGAGIRVIADELNNAILVWGSPADFVKIEATLKRLDLAPTQVLIEASIIEVTLNDELKYGLQWFFQGSVGGRYNGTGVLSTADGGVLGGALAGFSYSVRNPLGEVRAVLNALADKSLVKVISSPSLMVLDNHTAAIAVGDQQPIQTATTITDGGNTTTSIQYKDTGVSLAVTPSVNAGNVVTMLINQSVTDVGQIDSATGQRSFLQRQIGSKVSVRSGETLVLGGLIRDNTTTSRSGVPILHDIPVIGNLFGTTTRDTARTELLVVITPRVVRSDQEMRDVSEEFRSRLKGLEAFDDARKSSPAPESATRRGFEG